MDLAAQRLQEAAYQREMLKRELAYWQARTADHAGVPAAERYMEKHHSQVTRIAGPLALFLDGAGATGAHRAATASGDAAAQSLAESEALQTKVAFAHRLWDFFRSKLALRDVDRLRPGLQCADELAWECYRPVRDLYGLVNGQAPEELPVKEPPLVFFHSEGGPFVQQRDTVFVEYAAGEVERFGRSIMALPVPVVGLPWFQVGHLPGMLAVAHEAGHAADQDFGIRDHHAGFAGTGVRNAHVEKWDAWRSEIFADIFAVLALGPAYVRTLMSYLATDPHKVRRAGFDGAAYPSRHLRMLLNLEALRQLNLDAEAQPLRKAWKRLYVGGDERAYEADVEQVVAALLEGELPSLGGMRLPDIGRWEAANSERVAELVARFRQDGAAASVPEGESFRHLFAAAAGLYYDDPEAYLAAELHTRLLELMVAAIPAGQRSATESAPEDRLAADARRAADHLLALFEDEEAASGA